MVLFYLKISHFFCFQSPEVYYNSLRAQLGFDDLIDFMKFNYHLENLFDGDWKVKLKVWWDARSLCTDVYFTSLSTKFWTFRNFPMLPRGGG